MPILSEPTGRPSRRAESRKKLLEATEALLAAGGHYAELSVERIAQSAGVARSTFYVQFADRRQLLLALCEQAVNPLTERVAELAEAGPPPDQRRIADAMETVLSLARAHAPLLRAVVEAAGYDEEVGRYWRTLNDELARALARRLAEQQSIGRARSLAPGAAAQAFVAMVRESCIRQISGQSPISDDELAETLATIWWRAAYELADQGL